MRETKPVRFSLSDILMSTTIINLSVRNQAKGMNK